MKRNRELRQAAAKCRALCDYYDPVDALILRDADDLLAQSAREDEDCRRAQRRAEDASIALRAAEDAYYEQAQRQADESMFADLLHSAGFCSLSNVRTFMSISKTVALNRATSLITLLAASGRAVRSIQLDHLAQDALLLAARRIIPSAAPSGRSIPSDCLTPRILSQRPIAARVARAC